MRSRTLCHGPVDARAARRAPRASARSITLELYERIQGLRRIVYDSRDYQEGLNAFRAKRKPQFTGQ